MVNLVNIKRDNKILSADYYYYDETDRGSLSIDDETGELLSYRYNNFDKSNNGSYIFSKVIRFLRRGIGSTKTPEKCTYLWY